MSATNKHTAILIFARNAHEELRHKSFYARAGYRKNLALARHLNQKVTRLAEKTQLSTIRLCEKEQTGNNFGQRLSNAIHASFAKGYEQLIIIGNDCPSLSEEHLLSAADHITSKQVVLGPALDGGTYLIGLHRDSFNPLTFSQLPWQKTDLLSSLIEIATDSYTHCHLLSPEVDIDQPSDIQYLMSQLGLQSIVAPLLRLLGLLQQAISAHHIDLDFQPLLLPALRPHRGPPKPVLS